jgi:hypothetical protein
MRLATSETQLWSSVGKVTHMCRVYQIVELSLPVLGKSRESGEKGIYRVF